MQANVAMQVQANTLGGIPMRIQFLQSSSIAVTLACFFLTGCFEWCPFCSKEDKKFQPKPTYSLNTLGTDPAAVIQPKATTETADLPGAGAVSNVGNTLDGKPIDVSTAPRINKVVSNPIATSNPPVNTSASQIKYTPENQTQKQPVHTIPVSEYGNKDARGIKSIEPQELGIPQTSLTPSLQSIPEIKDNEPVTMPAINAKGKELNTPAIDSVIIPPTPGLGLGKIVPPTTILPPAGANTNSAPLGIPAAPQATPYR